MADRNKVKLPVMKKHTVREIAELHRLGIPPRDDAEASVLTAHESHGDGPVRYSQDSMGDDRGLIAPVGLPRVADFVRDAGIMVAPEGASSSASGANTVSTLTAGNGIQMVSHGAATQRKHTSVFRRVFRTFV